MIKKIISRLDEKIVGYEPLKRALVSKIVMKIKNPEYNRHILIFGPPGTGKTTLVRELSEIIKSELGVNVNVVRITGNADLLPSDFLYQTRFIKKKDGNGQEYYDTILTPRETFKLLERKDGQIGILVFEEIDKVPAVTLNALLEAMQEQQITLDGKTYRLNFLMIAVANTKEYDPSAKELGAALSDRFADVFHVGYLDILGDLSVIELKYADARKQFLKAGFDVKVPDWLLLAMVLIVKLTQTTVEGFNDYSKYIRRPAGPRGYISLLFNAMEEAVSNGAKEVDVKHIKSVAVRSLEGRIELNYDGLAEFGDKKTYIKALVEEVFNKQREVQKQTAVLVVKLPKSVKIVVKQAEQEKTQNSDGKSEKSEENDSEKDSEKKENNGGSSSDDPDDFIAQLVTSASSSCGSRGELGDTNSEGGGDGESEGSPNFQSFSFSKDQFEEILDDIRNHLGDLTDGSGETKDLSEIIREEDSVYENEDTVVVVRGDRVSITTSNKDLQEILNESVGKGDDTPYIGEIRFLPEIKQFRSKLKKFGGISGFINKLNEYFRANPNNRIAPRDMFSFLDMLTDLTLITTDLKSKTDEVDPSGEFQDVDRRGRLIPKTVLPYLALSAPLDADKLLKRKGANEKGANILLVIDASGSMSGFNIVSAIAVAKVIASKYSSVSDANLALIAFTSNPTVIVEPWGSMTEVITGLQSIYASGGTSYGRALELATEIAPPKTNIVIVGDFYDYESPPNEVLTNKDAKKLKFIGVIPYSGDPDYAISICDEVYTTNLTPIGLILDKLK